MKGTEVRNPTKIKNGVSKLKKEYKQSNDILEFKISMVEQS